MKTTMTRMVTVALVLALVAGGCITIRTPEGTTTTRVDLDTTIAIAQLSFNIAKQAVQLWEQYRALSPEQNLGISVVDQPAYDAELARLQADVEKYRTQLSELYKIKAGEPVSTAPE